MDLARRAPADDDVLLDACCPTGDRQALVTDASDELTTMFAVLADPAHFRMLMRVLHEARVSTCVPVTSLTAQPATAEHRQLEALRAAGLLERTPDKRRRWACYRPAPDALARLRCVLDLPADGAWPVAAQPRPMGPRR
ncbi:hypothetical protein LO772_27075 [Yinghuangia sp. ASG 101]|uniref:ArsR/SmtB family transcription factor n=1 Tax=Yinghuangia sp. ASG 101 TaxID=2896848 RepID=UPI001E634EFA|nr:hypothetical protein [Yinghuangia sp. ASG 101]UGQ10477.1 hypothetical protein LO772_27075 [Yinghuangia sp. ASG 101]